MITGRLYQITGRVRNRQIKGCCTALDRGTQPGPAGPFFGENRPQACFPGPQNPLSGTPSPLPVVPAGLPGGKDVRKEFLLPQGKLWSAKIHPRTAHVAAADFTWRGCGPSKPPRIFRFPDNLCCTIVCNEYSALKKGDVAVFILQHPLSIE